MEYFPCYFLFMGLSDCLRFISVLLLALTAADLLHGYFVSGGISL